MAGGLLSPSAVLLVFCCAAMGGVLFEDDFSDGDDNGWTHVGSAEFAVISQEYLIYSQGNRGQGTSLNGDAEGIMSTADYSVLCAVTMEAGLTAGVCARYTGEDGWYYRLVLKPYSENLVLERRNDTGPSIGLDEYQYGILLDTRYFVRLQVEGDLIRGRIWAGSLSDEPDDWHVTAQDGIQAEPGSFGLFGAGYGKQLVSWSMIFDDVEVSTPVPDSFHPCTWASIKSAGF